MAGNDCVSCPSAVTAEIFARADGLLKLDERFAKRRIHWNQRIPRTHARIELEYYVVHDRILVCNTSPLTLSILSSNDGPTRRLAGLIDV